MGHGAIIKDFIRAERRGNWMEHLAATGKMLNLYAAAGHNNYAMSAHLYLQMMTKLEFDNRWLHKQFSDFGYRCVADK